MYNILIVDDEYYICEGLSRKIQQLNNPLIKESRSVLSGEEALELIKSYKPQIVFTDIKMNGIDGIELIRKLNKRLHPVQFIILSGYDDFDYVRGAFQNGAIDYLLKPILKEDLTRILDTALSNLNRFPSVTDNPRESLFQISADILQKLAQLPATAPLPSGLLNTLTHIGFTENCAFSILVFNSIPPYEATLFWLNKLYDHFEHILCNTLSENKIGILCEEQCYDSLKIFIEQLMKDSSDFPFCMKNKSWAASISDLGTTATLPQLFRQAEQLLCLRLTHGYEHVFTESSEVSAQGFSPRLKHFISQLIETPALVANPKLQEVFRNEIEKLTLPDLANFFYYFNEILNISHFNNGTPDWNYKNPDLSDFSSYSELETYFFKRLTDYSRQLTSQPSISGTMDIVRDYIDMHYMEDLTLANLAEHFFMSYSYLSKSFHKTFHMNFQEYLRMLRMEHALELLKKPELSIQQIAASVGYENAFNFSRSFKAEYGVSPSYFRNGKN